MNREEFGEWGGQLEDRMFWQAVAMLGVLGSLRPSAPPRNAGDAEADLAVSWRWPVWYISDEYLQSALRGELVDARWLATRWQKPADGRIQSAGIYANQQEVVAAFKQHLGVVLYSRLETLTPAADWQWPMRIALSRTDRHEKLWNALQDWHGESGVVSQLVRFSHADREPVVELLVLPGMPEEALQELQTFPTPIRAHCLILLCEDAITVEFEQVKAAFRLQQLTLSKGVVISSLRDGNPSQWIVDLLYKLTHNLPIDQVLANVVTPPPVMFFDPELFEIARAGRFADKIADALEGAGDTPLALGTDAARRIWLDEGHYPAVDVAYRMRNVLREPYAFNQEIRGSTLSVEILKAARKDNVLKQARLESYSVREASPRRLQMDVWENGDRAEHFHAACHYDVDAWIGEQEGALSGGTFPEELLPGDEDGYLLTMTLFAPGHMEQPLVETVYLPRAGESTRGRFSFKTNAEIPRFEARITIAYLNRVLQTYLLTGAPDEPIALTPELATAARWHGLDRQASYGATVVLNRMQGQHQAMMQAGYKALAFSLEGLGDAITLMESMLDSSKWEQEEFKGIKAKGSSRLILYLAKHGSDLFEAMKRYAPADKAGQAFLNNLLKADPVQVLAANLGARLPIELFYANPQPEDDAKLCPTYTDEPARESCDRCPHVDPDHYCPLGFWSLRKVIEWHDFEAAKLKQNDFAPREFAVEAADDWLRRDRLGKVGQALVGLSSNVDKEEPESSKKLVERIRAAGIDPVVVTDWGDWIKKIEPEGNRLLVLLPHTAKNDFDQDSLEICGKAITKIDEAYVASGRRPGPIVLLIGCNTENLGIPFRNFVVKFMTGGSAIVVSTITHVLGRHAAPLAAELVEAITEAQKDEHTTFGELMRDVRRKWLRRDLPPISLGLKCYGDARWRF